MDAATEKKLVEEAKKDPAAFGRLFEEYYPRILKYASFRTGNAEIARDVTSETFFKALKNLWQFRWMGYSFSSWLYRIAGNEINMYFRRLKYEPRSLDEALENDPSLTPASLKSLEEEAEQAQKAIDNNNEYLKIKEQLLKLPPPLPGSACPAFLRGNEDLGYRKSAREKRGYRKIPYFEGGFHAERFHATK